ncbi:MAG: amidase [Pseudohongiellaceae bacterium]
MPVLDPDHYLSLDAVAQAAGLRAGEFSTSDLVGAAIARAEQVNPGLNVFSSQRFTEASNEASRNDADAESLQRSPLAGLPFLVKDLSALAGQPCEKGSRLYQGHVAAANSAIVQRFLDAGLVVLGKTNTPEFGLTLTTEPVSKGATRNPWDTGYSTGGSSGGAAAAVASGIVPAAHASDGGGSIRIPASCCGLFGLKPSRGLTIIEPSMRACWSGMSVGLVVSRSVRDSAAYLDLLRTRKPILFPLPEAPASFSIGLEQPAMALRIAVMTQHPLGETLHPQVRDAILGTARLCEELGHQVQEIAPPIDFKPPANAMNNLICLHTWQEVAAMAQARNLDLETAELETSTRLMAQLGSELSAADYAASLDVLAAAAQQMADFHQRYDMLLAPVLNRPTAELGWLDMNSDDIREYVGRYREYSGYTALFNGTGQPAMSVPLGQDSHGLPIGSQFSAGWGQDALLLRLARQLEQARPWPLLAPDYAPRAGTGN